VACGLVFSACGDRFYAAEIAVENVARGLVFSACGDRSQTGATPGKIADNREMRHLYFPAHAGEAAAPAADEGAVAIGRGERILVIDDEDLLARMMEEPFIFQCARSKTSAFRRRALASEA